VNNTFWIITESLKKLGGKFQKFLESNENTTYQNLWSTVKVILRGIFIAMSAYTKEIKEFSNK
jgi:hypothetical protein